MFQDVAQDDFAHLETHWSRLGALRVLLGITLEHFGSLRVSFLVFLADLGNYHLDKLGQPQELNILIRIFKFRSLWETLGRHFFTKTVKCPLEAISSYFFATFWAFWPDTSSEAKVSPTSRRGLALTPPRQSHPSHLGALRVQAQLELKLCAVP